jgi:putative cell wall-binding protein
MRGSSAKTTRGKSVRSRTAAILAVALLSATLGALPTAAGAAELPHPDSGRTEVTPPPGFGLDSGKTSVPDAGAGDGDDGSAGPDAADVPTAPRDEPWPLDGIEKAPDPVPNFESYAAPGGSDASRRAATATLHGTLSTDGTPWEDPGEVTILAYYPSGGYNLTTLTALGDYSIPLPAGSFDITAVYQGAGNLLSPAPVKVTAVAGGDYTVDITLVRAGTITGSLSAAVAGTYIQPSVTVVDVTGGRQVLANPKVEYGPGTAFEVSGLPEGDYRLFFDGGSTVQWEWWKDEHDSAVADQIHVGLSEAVTGIDVVLQNTNTLRGVVRTANSDGTLVPAANVLVETAEYGYTTVTDANGAYDLHGFPEGTYSFRFRADGTGPAWGTTVTEEFDFDQGGRVVDRDAVVGLAGSITGSVSVKPDEGASPQPGTDVEVQASVFVPETGEYLYVASGGGPNYTISDLGPGQYLVRFIDEADRSVRDEYYNDALYRSEATLVTVTAGQATNGISAQLDPLSYWTYRYGGADRYEVAANLSHDAFAPGVPALYIASGEKFPDALSAGPAAARQNGALLLVTRDTIPSSTREAISYLKPAKIVVVGGTDTVSAAVYNQLKQLQPDIVRVAGADRYEVSRNVVDYAFCGGSGGACNAGAKTIFFATGANFPDALSAGPAAAHLDGAVLLVPGPAEIDAATSGLLTRLGAKKFYITGGTASVSDAFHYSLEQAHPFAVSRLDGADRYEVSAYINAVIFRNGETAFLASGAVFADALSGGPAAATIDAPLYLVHSDCLPNSVWMRITEYGPVDLLLLGGPNTLNDDVLHLRWLCAPY